LAFLIATVFAVSPVFAATTPSGGFSSAPGMHAPESSVASAPIDGDPGVPGLPADRGTPSGGFSSAAGMSPDTTVSPDVASTSGAGVSGDPLLQPVSAGMTSADPCALSGGFSSASGMSPDTSGVSASTLCDPGAPGLPADRGTPSGGFTTAPGMSPDTTVPPVRTTQ